jgi:GTPase SAR1 family protein
MMAGLTVAVVGAPGTGKTTLVKRFFQGDADDRPSTLEYSPTIACRSSRGTLRLMLGIAGERCISLQLWDTPGRVKENKVVQELVRSQQVDAFIIVYDGSSKRGLKDMRRWVEAVAVATTATGLDPNSLHRRVLVLNNKGDLVTKHSHSQRSEAYDLAVEHRMQFADCSALVGTNVVNSVTILLGNILGDREGLRTHWENARRSVRVMSAEEEMERSVMVSQQTAARDSEMRRSVATRRQMIAAQLSQHRELPNSAADQDPQQKELIARLQSQVDTHLVATMGAAAPIGPISVAAATPATRPPHFADQLANPQDRSLRQPRQPVGVGTVLAVNSPEAAPPAYAPRLEEHQLNETIQRRKYREKILEMEATILALQGEAQPTAVLVQEVAAMRQFLKVKEDQLASVMESSREQVTTIQPSV